MVLGRFETYHSFSQFVAKATWDFSFAHFVAKATRDLSFAHLVGEATWNFAFAKANKATLGSHSSVELVLK